MANMGYKAALRWIVNNDDTDWLFDGKIDFLTGTTDVMISVTAAMVCDIYNKDQNKVVIDLYKMKTGAMI